MLALNGVAPDTRDYSWFVQIRDDIASHLTPSEIAEAERLADAFQAQPEICFAENNPVDAQFQFYFGMEISGFEQYPQDMKCFMAYAAACEHLAGEEGYDEERRQYLHDALNQYCPAAETRQIALKKKYEHNEEMQRVLSVYDRR
ncbi:hypothetical protein AGMMS49545_22970 [Betaproteobacteria bacterium]|nr:hypothetical protein AGMMS49545_22970 [Betaproteobacteria bacterium]